jgi:hypothetical protein
MGRGQGSSTEIQTSGLRWGVAVWRGKRACELEGKQW